MRLQVPPGGYQVYLGGHAVEYEESADSEVVMVNQSAGASTGRDSQQDSKNKNQFCVDNDSIGVRLQLPSEWAQSIHV